MNPRTRRGAWQITATGATPGVLLAIAAALGADLQTLRGAAIAGGIIAGVALTPARAVICSSRRSRLLFVLAIVVLIVVTVAGSALGYLLAYPLAGAAGAEFAGGVLSIIGLYSVGVSVGGALIASQLTSRGQRQAGRSSTGR